MWISPRLAQICVRRKINVFRMCTFIQQQSGVRNKHIHYSKSKSYFVVGSNYRIEYSYHQKFILFDIKKNRQRCLLHHFKEKVKTWLMSFLERLYAFHTHALLVKKKHWQKSEICYLFPTYFIEDECSKPFFLLLLKI